MSVSKDNWGVHEGYAVYLFTLKNDSMAVRLTNFGATVVGIDAPDKNGVTADVVLGYDDLLGYVNGTSFQGAMVGRFANRIAGAKFSLGQEEYVLAKNDGENCIHGGINGFSRRVFEYKINEKQNGVTFTYRSYDMEEGFPFALNITVKYTLTDKNKLKIKYTAKSEGDTIFSPTNHAYFNLKGEGGVLDTILQINAANYTPSDEFSIPTGEIKSVNGTPFNFTKPKPMGAYIGKGKIDGYDNNYILGEFGDMRKAAVAYEPESGRIMAVFTDMPALQFYTANHLNERGKGSVFFGKQQAFCLETQFTPNTPNLPDFPSCVVKKGKPFKSTTIYAFGVKA